MQHKRRFLGNGIMGFIVLVASAAGSMFACDSPKADGAPSEETKRPVKKSEEARKAMDVIPQYSDSHFDVTPLSKERVSELAKKLDPEAYQVTQKSGTEPAFCGTLLDNKKEGFYACVVCGLPLFNSDHKFDSGTGWPSFYREYDPKHVSRKKDDSHFMSRTEINCARCDAHLGHVFPDGPKPTGERHCLNSASLKFFEKGAELPVASQPIEMETAYFAGGCFWGIEHYFQKGTGVLDAVSGYMQGKGAKPTYKEVCSGTTGHAETVKVVFDPKRISFRTLLEAFFKMHDPTQLNYQGPDHGTQYRSGVWYVSDAQKAEAEKYVAELKESGRFGDKLIVTQIEKAAEFYPAEDYHQDYVVKTGRACHVTNPWN